MDRKNIRLTTCHHRSGHAQRVEEEVGLIRGAGAWQFYSTLFATEPAKRRPGYANFAVANPPLKLVLFENPEATGTLNHLGVERDRSPR